jgi:hypothetical protein
MRVECSKCGAVFTRRKADTWKRLCLECWKQQHTPQAEPARVAFLEMRLAIANGRVAELEAQHGQGPFSPEELRTLRRLVHPDKHGGSESATRMSQKVNALLQHTRG